MNSLEFFSNHLQDYLDELQALTAIETPTGDLEKYIGQKMELKIIKLTRRRRNVDR